MANTRSAAKRARQTIRRQERNTLIRSAAKTAVRGAVQALKTKDLEKAKSAYRAAVRALSKAASKYAIPRARAERKISRLTLLAKKLVPTVF